MLAVVVLVPIVLMIAACLLERFEAHATHVRPEVRARTPRPASPAPGTTPGPALALVPGTDQPGTDAPAAAATTLDDPDTLRLPRAS
ncbi:hypothetical protein ACR9E3_03270 [Actinomycetospora sp. C-140]